MSVAARLAKRILGRLVSAGAISEYADALAIVTSELLAFQARAEEEKWSPDPPSKSSFGVDGDPDFTAARRPTDAVKGNPVDFPDDWFASLFGPEPCANRSDLDLEDDLRSASTTRSLLAAQAIRDREVWRARLDGARSAWRLARKEMSDLTVKRHLLGYEGFHERSWRAAALCAEAVRHLAEVVPSPAGLSILGLAKRAAQAVKDLTAQYNGATLDLADLRSVEQGLRATCRRIHETLAAVLPERLPGIDLPVLAERVAGMVGERDARVYKLTAELGHLRRVVAAQEDALVRGRTHIEDSARSRLAESSALREEIEKLRAGTRRDHAKIEQLERAVDSQRRAAAELRAAMPTRAEPASIDLLDGEKFSEYLVGLACRAADRLRTAEAEAQGHFGDARRVLRRVAPDFMPASPVSLSALAEEVERRFIAQGARLQAAEIATEEARPIDQLPEMSA